ncbi:MAG TPA: hypothetical protein VFQ39_04900, partial [Longimicrobium sp.]|nr:hypothetical protein [Longimicrobium sp.]
QAPVASAIDLDALRSWDAVAALAANDFEPVVVARIPVLRDALAALREGGARIALLAGSGSSVFGVFADEHARDAAESRLAALGMRCWRAETLTEFPAPRLDFPRSRG